MDMFQEFVVPLALAGAFVVGWAIKHLIPNDTVNRFIPIICALTGAAITCWSALDINAELVVKGLVSGAASTMVYEQFKNMKKLKDDADSSKKGYGE